MKKGILIILSIAVLSILIVLIFPKAEPKDCNSVIESSEANLKESSVAEVSSIIAVESKTESREPLQEPEPTTESKEQPQETESISESTEELQEMVWISRWGRKYHNNHRCSGMKNPAAVSEEFAIFEGYTPCANCYNIVWE